MDKPQKQVRVTRTTDRRSPRGVRRLGQALIALAQAQAEAEAQAQAEATAVKSGRRPSAAKRSGDDDHGSSRKPE